MYKEALEAALRKYDEVVEKRNALAGGEVTDEVKTQITDLDAQADSALEEARSAQAGLARETEAAELRSKVASLVIPSGSTKSEDAEANKLRSLVRGEVRSFDFKIDTRAVKLNVVTGGSALSLGAAVYNAIHDRTSVLRAGATVRSTDSEGIVTMPTVSPALTAPNGALPETNMTTTALLSAYKYGAIVNIPNEFVEDTSFDLVAEVARQTAVAVKNTVPFLTGTGSSQPTGVLVDSVKGADAVAAAITPDDIYELFYSVDNYAQDNGAWIMNPLTAAYVRNVASNLWSADVASDNPNLLLGRPVITDSGMPLVATGNKSVLFGDFSAYFVRQVSGLRAEASNDYHFGNDQTSVRVVWRVDAKLLDGNAVKHLKHA